MQGGNSIINYNQINYETGSINRYVILGFLTSFAQVSTHVSWQFHLLRMQNLSRFPEIALKGAQDGAKKPDVLLSQATDSLMLSVIIIEENHFKGKFLSQPNRW